MLQIPTKLDHAVARVNAKRGSLILSEFLIDGKVMSAADQERGRKELGVRETLTFGGGRQNC